MQALHEEQQQALLQQNLLLEERVQSRTAELSSQKETLQQTLTELKASQQQLVQKEKMASLGQLTAGIAHEIQNPLNFVLNFSEINSELIDETKQLINKGDLPDQFRNEIVSLTNDLADNMSKIRHHGKRADGIVKNMLQHSRQADGVMELTDLNELANEYLNLGYSGFRSRHKQFTCHFENSRKRDLEKIMVIPQDIGQILLNIFKNAFYSMNEKQRIAGAGFEPVLHISTALVNKKAVITVRDNGLGIAEKNIHKIFQPFFTTKPTGEATGLGLSLSYDMVKAHQGELKVDSKEGDFAEFTMELSY